MVGRSGADRTVTIFDVDLPPGVAFVRSLGRAGVPVVVATSDRTAAGRLSRYAATARACPHVRRSDEFVGWLADELATGSIDLVAPTSDYVAFAVAAAIEKVGIEAAAVGHPEPDAVRTCLFKDRFYAAAPHSGLPAPPSATATTTAEAIAVARELQYPVVLKPRTHAGLGVRRGTVVRNAVDLAATFGPLPLSPGQSCVLVHDPDLALPVIQHYYELGTVTVISLSGYIGRDGSMQALTHCRKVSQSPRRLGVGTMFEPIGDQPFTEQAVGAVRDLLGTGIFELEVLVDVETGAHGAVDLNPRAFGQLTLDIALGRDLPVLWYNDVTGSDLPGAPPARRPPRFWHDAVGSYVGFGVRLARGPHRKYIAEHAWGRMVSPSVGAMHEWRDPLPGLRFGLAHFRHPRAFLRPFLVDTEVVPGVVADVDGSPLDGRSL